MKITALYERLSVDDDNPGDSVSIRNQKAMLEEYARQHGYEPFRHFTDDGYSGTNVHRPGFRAMMALVEKGEIERIIVKDLSRFGRDYLRTGFYVDVLFPELDIHFIAIHSHTDTRSGAPSDYIPFINIMNDIVNRERSQKQKARHARKWAEGRHVPHLPLYGYLYDSNNPERYIPDPEAAPVVREIFRMRDDGMTCTEIAAELTRREIPTRAWHMYCELREEDYPPVCQPMRGAYDWTLHAVMQVLSTEEYTGVRLIRKYESPEIRRSVRSADPICLEDQHEALVSRDLFFRVQEQKLHYDRRDTQRVLDRSLGIEPHILCPDCSHPLTLWIENGRPTYVCRDCRRQDPQNRLKLFKEDLQVILHRILTQCWDPNVYRFPERITPEEPDGRDLTAAFERNPEPAAFLTNRCTRQYLRQQERMEEERKRIAAQRRLLRSPQLDLYSLALYSENCFWQQIIPEKQHMIENHRRFQEITVVTLFRDPCPILTYSPRFCDYHVRILPVSPDAPLLSEQLRICLQQGLLPKLRLRSKSE